MWKVSSFISIGIVDMCTFVNKNKNRQPSIFQALFCNQEIVVKAQSSIEL